MADFPGDRAAPPLDLDALVEEALINVAGTQYAPSVIAAFVRYRDALREAWQESSRHEANYLAWKATAETWGRTNSGLNETLRAAEAERDRLLGVLDDFARAAHAVLHGPSYVSTTPEQIAAARHRLAVLAGKYDRPASSVAAPPDQEGT